MGSRSKDQRTGNKSEGFYHTGNTNTTQPPETRKHGYVTYTQENCKTLRVVQELYGKNWNPIVEVCTLRFYNHPLMHNTTVAQKELERVILYLPKDQ